MIAPTNIKLIIISHHLDHHNSEKSHGHDWKRTTIGKAARTARATLPSWFSSRSRRRLAAAASFATASAALWLSSGAMPPAAGGGDSLRTTTATQPGAAASGAISSSAPPAARRLARAGWEAGCSGAGAPPASWRLLLASGKITKQPPILRTFQVYCVHAEKSRRPLFQQ